MKTPNLGLEIGMFLAPLMRPDDTKSSVTTKASAGLPKSKSCACFSACHMVTLYTVWYNYARINSAVKMAPAMAAGISSRL